MNTKKVTIVEGAVCSAHIHLCVEIPIKYSVSDFGGYLKGKRALMLFDKHPKLSNKWDRTFGARGYYVAIIGNVTEDAIKRYIKEQEEEAKREESER